MVQSSPGGQLQSNRIQFSQTSHTSIMQKPVLKGQKLIYPNSIYNGR